MPIYNYDRFGFCCVCSGQVAQEVSKGNWELLSNHDEAEVIVSDNSKMRVCVCTTCKPLVKDNLELIMAKVYNGWLHDLEGLPWDEAKKQAYIDKYSQLTIKGVA